MISPAGNFNLYLASKPIDFRKGMDGLAAIVMNEFDPDSFNGAIFIFRSKRSDRLKLIVWDGTGLVMTYKRIGGSGFVWPQMTDGVISINRAQFEALFEGLDWQRVVPKLAAIRFAGLCGSYTRTCKEHPYKARTIGIQIGGLVHSWRTKQLRTGLLLSEAQLNF